jgi:hypothetical protein
VYGLNSNRAPPEYESKAKSLCQPARSIDDRYNMLLTTAQQLATGRKVRVPAEAKFVTSPRRPDQFWGPLSFLYRG